MDVLFEAKQGHDGCIGVITLNRPDVLNSLNHTMILAMHDQLLSWAKADDIKAVVIQAAEGRAFCAGGDLRLTYERIRAHDVSARYFFRDEYFLNRLIFHYPKPYIALLDGITMGGGVGISIHGSHRVVTEKVLFAMPETGIGFFPDVGGTYFLPRLAGKLGYYLGLTGARLKVDDCVALGIAQCHVMSTQLPHVLSGLLDSKLSIDAHGTVTRLIQSLSVKPAPSSLLAQQHEIDACFSKASMEDIVLALSQAKESHCQQAAEMLTKKSPTSLKVTLRALQESYALDFDAIMEREYRLACHFMEDHDFSEGIRAVIIDKDQSPQWAPATLNQVTDQSLNKYFNS